MTVMRTVTWWAYRLPAEVARREPKRLAYAVGAVSCGAAFRIPEADSIPMCAIAHNVFKPLDAHQPGRGVQL